MCCDDCSDEDGQRYCVVGCWCECHDYDPLDGVEWGDDDGPCIGAGCCNPHPGHRYGECVTAEQMAEYHAEGEASAEKEVKS